MSLSEQFEGRRAQLLRLVDSGMPVPAAAEAVGMARNRAYEVLRAWGMGARYVRTRITQEHRGRVLAEYAVTGSVTRAPAAAGVGWDAAALILRRAGVRPAPARRDWAGLREAFMELVGQGWSVAPAAAEVGVPTRTGYRWRSGQRRAAGTRSQRGAGVVDRATDDRYTGPRSTSAAMPATEPTTVPTTEPTTQGPAGAEDALEGGPVGSGRYLSLPDRLAIADGLATRKTITAIAAGIGRHKSAVSREVKARSVQGVYLPYRAHQGATAARARPKTAKLVANTALRREVEQGLERKLSPEQICHRLLKDFPDNESMRVSHETIYQALYLQARGGLKREVAKALRTGRTRRKPHARPDQRRPRFTNMITIAERPPQVQDRAVPGHWEGDLIMGKLNQSAIATLVERTTRYTMLVHLPDGHTAEQVRDGLIKTMTTLPEHLRGSLTWDQGNEMALHQDFTLAADMAVYFCDPASPWQRGSNENTNGLLRQYFPKGTDLSVHGPEDLEHVAQELNGRPRKTLDWDTPAERLRVLLIQ